MDHQFLKQHVAQLSKVIGERNYIRCVALEKAAGYLHKTLAAMGYAIRVQEYNFQGQTFKNLEAEVKGRKIPQESVVIGAHYDSVIGCPGADDNATGVAGVLELARHFSKASLDRTLKFVCFVNEEPPFFQTEGMGSWQYAKACRERGEVIRAMISLETIGYFSDKPNSQNYPPALKPFYPSTGNFIALVGNLKSRHLVKLISQSFQKKSALPIEAGNFPEFIPGVGWSDQWSFWQHDYPAVMFTDTAPYRNPHYHLSSDTSDSIDYPRFAAVVDGVSQAVFDLAQARPS